MALPSPTAKPIVAGEIPQGRQKYIFVTTVANIAAPTSAELTAGTEWSNQIMSVDGFAPSGATIDQPNAGSRQVPNIPGLVTLGDGTITFNLSKTGTGDARSQFNDGTDGVTTQTAGYWYFLYEGITTGGQMRGYQCTVIKSEASSALDAPKTLAVQFALQNATGFIAVPTT